MTTIENVVLEYLREKNIFARSAVLSIKLGLKQTIISGALHRLRKKKLVYLSNNKYWGAKTPKELEKNE